MGRVLLQAGHQGRTSGATGGSVTLDGTTYNEKDLTPQITSEAARLLRGAGHTVLEVKADDFDDQTPQRVDIALSVHFDSSSSPCASGTSFGYPKGKANEPFVDVLRAAYRPHLPTFVKAMPDNFTKGLEFYGDYADWITTDAEAVFEVCELSCPEQARWILPRLGWVAAVIAHAIDRKLGGSAIAHPNAAPPAAAPPAFDDVPLTHPFYDDVIWAAERGYMNGHPNKPLWYPNEPVTRAQLAAVLRRAVTDLEYDPANRLDLPGNLGLLGQ